MKPMTNAEYNTALSDPWAWCLSEIHRRNLPSATVAIGSGINRSTIRALYNGRSGMPEYVKLTMILKYLIDTRGEAPMAPPSGKNSGLLPGMDRSELPYVPQPVRPTVICSVCKETHTPANK